MALGVVVEVMLVIGFLPMVLAGLWALASAMARGSKKRQSAGQPKGVASAISTRQRCTTSPPGVVLVE